MFFLLLELLDKGIIAKLTMLGTDILKFEKFVFLEKLNIFGRQNYDFFATFVFWKILLVSLFSVSFHIDFDDLIIYTSLLSSNIEILFGLIINILE